MGAAVGFRSGLSRNWTGSLSELNHCRPHLGRGFLSWHDGESNLSEPDDMKIFRGNVVDYVRSSSSVGTSLLKFRHLLRTIHKSLSDENVPHGIAHEEQNSPSLSPARNNHVQNTDYLTSADSLIESLFDDHLERMLLHSRRLYFHQRSKRRNCASESDLRWSSLDDLNAFPLESNSSQPREFKDEKASSQDTKSTSDQYVDKKQCATEKSAPLVTHFPSSIPVDIYGTDTKNESELTASDYRIEEQTNKLEEVSPDVAQPPSSEMAERSLSENYLCVCASLQKVAEYGKEEPVIMLEVAKATDSLNSLEIGLKDRSASIEFEVTQPTTKLQKSVIFADEVGQSLTETFVFHREESFKSYVLIAGTGLPRIQVATNFQCCTNYIDYIDSHKRFNLSSSI
ncbi:unnamed protein product [Dicrocoelium dendriticum]|nr:unnamed protein product [Dicrocoelium dendriticum]